MKKLIFPIAILLAAMLACDISQSPTPTTPTPIDAVLPTLETIETAPIPATKAPESTPIETVPPFEGLPASFGRLSLVLPPGIANGFSGSEIPRDDGSDVPPWGLTPGHTVLNLDGYLLQGKFHKPQIFVYPATGYAELQSGAFESMHRLRNVLDDPAMGNDVENLPFIPFFNAAPLFASNFQVVTFLNGVGVRFLTEYAQYFAPVNNHELFYHFQGFSDDGEYYIIAIFPITAPVLAETSDLSALLPTGGIPVPEIDDPDADFQGYYALVTDLLNSIPADSFSPTIEELDLLIRSLNIE
jgi:hypothetical protein